MTDQPFPKFRRTALAMTLALTLGAAACSGSGSGDKQAEAKSSAGATSSTSATPPEAGDQATDGSTTTSAPGGSVDSPPTGEPIATVNGSNPGSPLDAPVPLRLDVTSIERVPGDVVQVRFTITDLSEDEEATYEPYSTLDEGDGRTVSGARLLDLPNDKVYLPLLDGEKNCLCTDGLADLEIQPGTPAPMNVSFPAPPKDVKTVDFTLPGFDPANGLPLS